MRIRRENNFVSYFDEKTGRYMRTGIIKNGKDTGIDPFMSSFPELLDAGVKTNIHYVLSKKTIREAIEHLQNDDFPKEINAVVFLLHKPVGLGSYENMIRLDDKELEQFLSLIDEKKFAYKIGFDSCTVPALINNCKNIDINSLDTCEGGRWSAYITADMKMLPCSFDNQEKRWSVDLKNNSIKDAWDSDEFNEFRNHFLKACPDCKNRNICMGGCPIRPEIVLCHPTIYS